MILFLFPGYNMFSCLFKAAQTNSNYPNRFQTSKINSWLSSFIWATRKPRINSTTLYLPSSEAAKVLMDGDQCLQCPKPIYYLPESWILLQTSPKILWQCAHWKTWEAVREAVISSIWVAVRILTLCQEHESQGLEGSSGYDLDGSTLVLQVVIWEIRYLKTQFLSLPANNRFAKKRSDWRGVENGKMRAGTRKIFKC